MARSKQLFQEIESYAQNIGDTVRDPLLILDRDLRIKSANRAFYKMFQTQPDDTTGRLIHELADGHWNISALTDLLREIIPTNSHFDDFEVTGEFPRIGSRTMLLNARKLYRPGNRTVLLVLAIEDITERRRVETELENTSKRDRRIALALQRAQLFRPREDAFPGLAVKTVFDTASDDALVGGDFWDTFAFDTGKVAFVLGDIMGKGLRAAVFTPEIKYAMRAYVREHKQPATVLHQMNTYLCESHRLYSQGLNDDGDDSSVCLMFTVIDRISGNCSVCSAGMEPLLLLHNDGRTEEIMTTGLPLGVARDAVYGEAQFQLDYGDVAVMATDGITEARQGTAFLGYDGLMRLAGEAQHLPNLDLIANCILDGARAFGNGSLRDDACVMLAQRR